MLKLHLLGPVQVFSARGPVDPGPARQRCVLAALAVEMGRPVPIPALIDRVWDERPPQRAKHTLHVYLSRIRRMLADADPDARICRRSGGYALELGNGTLDMASLQAELGWARRSGATPAERCDALELALGLWQGPPLADLKGRWVEQVRQHWRQLFVDALIQWASVRLAAGRVDAVPGVLSQAILEFPLAEPLWAAQIRALAAAHRRAEALAAYEAARSRLADELGVGPGAELAALHLDILRAEHAGRGPLAVGG
jgi:DNA-binding SARP family transcriptional activator